MKGKPDKPVPEPISETIRESVHRVTIAGETIEYKAIAGILHLKKEIDKPVAAVFFIAYLRADTRDASERPITFSFNGGPGSSSVWLHLGVLGPRRVLMQADGHAFPPPYELVNNDYSLLDHTDLVFIDPVSTGYSRAVPGEDPK
ncbi:MAG: peptidase S10, partial [candidate division Zixibacteria bacterium]|nr:peptidase S10 [candidate division Zixibacteria bacterium]